MHIRHAHHTDFRTSFDSLISKLKNTKDGKSNTAEEQEELEKNELETENTTLLANSRARKHQTLYYFQPKPIMGVSPFPLSVILLIILSCCGLGVSENEELGPLMNLKSSLDPENKLLTSWTGSGDLCDGSYEGVACNEKGQVANISLQGKGLSGKLSPAVGQLTHLTGLYLHYNALYGKIPTEISSLNELSDLYLNVNNLSGEIPPELGNMLNLQGKDYNLQVF